MFKRMCYLGVDGDISGVTGLKRNFDKWINTKQN